LGDGGPGSAGILHAGMMPALSGRDSLHDRPAREKGSMQAARVAVVGGGSGFVLSLLNGLEPPAAE
jgi:hypothetical protein